MSEPRTKTLSFRPPQRRERSPMSRDYARDYAYES
jgi:hypothetical protein